MSRYSLRFADNVSGKIERFDEGTFIRFAFAGNIVSCTVIG